ncbi:unnamed protein product, partial [Clonostachys solani]
LCAVGKPKRFAFVSSTSTLDTDFYVNLSNKDGKAVMEADDLEGSLKGLATGYGQSKWASEYLSQMTTWSVYRRDLPDISNTVNAVPVTRVSRIVVAATFHLSGATKESLAVAQVTGHPRVTMNDWIGALEVYGYNAPLIPYSEWSAKVKNYVNDAAEKEKHALLPLFHFVVGNLPGNSIALELDDANALGALDLYVEKQGAQGDSQASSNINIQVLGTYLKYLVTIGFLPGPSRENGGQPLPKLDGDLSQVLTSSQFGGRSARS